MGGGDTRRVAWKLRKKGLILAADEEEESA
jgi:hypothetical protein